MYELNKIQGIYGNCALKDSWHHPGKVYLLMSMIAVEEVGRYEPGQMIWWLFTPPVLMSDKSFDFPCFLSQFQFKSGDVLKSLDRSSSFTDPLIVLITDPQLTPWCSCIQTSLSKKPPKLIIADRWWLHHLHSFLGGKINLIWCCQDNIMSSLSAVLAWTRPPLLFISLLCVFLLLFSLVFFTRKEVCPLSVFVVPPCCVVSHISTHDHQCAQLIAADSL